MSRRGRDHLTELLKAALKERTDIGAALARAVPNPEPVETHVIQQALATGWTDLDPVSN